MPSNKALREDEKKILDRREAFAEGAASLPWSDHPPANGQCPVCGLQREPVPYAVDHFEWEPVICSRCRVQFAQYRVKH